MEGLCGVAGDLVFNDFLPQEVGILVLEGAQDLSDRNLPLLMQRPRPSARDGRPPPGVESLLDQGPLECSLEWPCPLLLSWLFTSSWQASGTISAALLILAITRNKPEINKYHWRV